MVYINKKEQVYPLTIFGNLDKLELDIYYEEEGEIGGEVTLSKANYVPMGAITGGFYGEKAV